MADESCIFCKVVKEGKDFLYEDDKCIAVLDKFPVSRGHVLVISKEHAKDLTTTSDETLAKMLSAAKKMANRIDKVLKPAGIKVVSNIREPAGQGVMHLHIHVIPVYGKDEDRLAREVSMQASAPLNEEREMAAKEKEDLLNSLRIKQ